MDRDDWTTAELAMGDAFATELRRLILQRAIGQALSPALSPEKRAAVEITVLLQIAVSIAQRDLRLGRDDFLDHAREIFIAGSAKNAHP
jgi:hypothetical protein